jgi:hypothetical protein
MLFCSTDTLKRVPVCCSSTFLSKNHYRYYLRYGTGNSVPVQYGTTSRRLATWCNTTCSLLLSTYFRYPSCLGSSFMFLLGAAHTYEYLKAVLLVVGEQTVMCPYRTTVCYCQHVTGISSDEFAHVCLRCPIHTHYWKIWRGRHRYSPSFDFSVPHAKISDDHRDERAQWPNFQSCTDRSVAMRGSSVPFVVTLGSTPRRSG